MRQTIAKQLKGTDYLLHADMFNINKFKTDAKVLNTGLGEANLLNIAGGLASQEESIYVYGVAGFIMHRIEQLKYSCVPFVDKGKIVIFNAGKIGYSKLGAGHTIDNNKDICRMLNIDFLAPKNLEELNKLLNHLDDKNGIYYIELGKDYER